MPLQEPEFYYRQPAGLALQVVEQLGQSSRSLSPDAQAEVRRLLTDFRSCWFRPRALDPINEARPQPITRGAYSATPRSDGFWLPAKARLWFRTISRTRSAQHMCSQVVVG